MQVFGRCRPPAALSLSLVLIPLPLPSLPCPGLGGRDSAATETQDSDPAQIKRKDVGDIAPNLNPASRARR